MGFYKPTKGPAYLDGKWYDNWSKTELRKKIDYIPQNSVLFDRSLLENIRYGNENYKEN
jgi:ABC-type multidrug transport system fused ATPase/permease subunit